MDTAKYDKITSSEGISHSVDPVNFLPDNRHGQEEHTNVQRLAQSQQPKLMPVNAQVKQEQPCDSI
eukprot:scaffold670532_cov128-Prasinocladus_malaysianus.AAC.1